MLEARTQAMTSLFHSVEFCKVTMNRFGTVIDKDGRLASLELQGYIIEEAERAGWYLEYWNKDVGSVWQPPKQP
jgi:hypothetical protein